MATAHQEPSALGLAGPDARHGYAVWSGSFGDLEVRFVGRGPAESRTTSREEILSRIDQVPQVPPVPPPSVASARQVHSADVLAAVAGECGAGDALWTAEAGLALSIATADCVPVLLAGPEGLAAVHAGWRGLAAGIIPRTVETVVASLGADPARWSAWIGPSIGACCYEVGDDVARQVAAASTPAVVLAGPAGKPHLDLTGAALAQLRAAGVGTVARLSACTRCDAEALWSYRREGKGAGRNIGFIWRR
jgi:YfiH family protein